MSVNMQQIMESLQRIDPNNPASWPVPFKLFGIVLICIAILVGGYFAPMEWGIQTMLEQYDKATKKEQQLKETYLDKKLQAINLPLYREQMEEMEQTFGTMLRQLPNKNEVDNLLVDITQAGLGRGLDFVLFKPDKEKPKDFYAELPISIKVTGSYHELGQFVSDVAILPRIVTIGDISIASDAKGGRLAMTAIARTYRYLEADEIMARQAADKGKKGARPARGKK